MTDRFDHIIIGGGRRGLTAALLARRARTDAELLVVEAAPRPGGSLRTQRSNGFVCELGAFALDRTEVEPLLAALERPPEPLAARCESGAVFDGAGLSPVAIEPAPVSFRSGCEELAQACRRELGVALRLGRAAERLEPTTDGWQVTLAGEVPTTLSAAELTLALPLWAAAGLLIDGDPALEDVVGRLEREPRAFVFLGGTARECSMLTGFGVTSADGLDSPMVEAIYCSEAFADRCLPDRSLVRCELVGEATQGGDAEVVALARAELRRWTACDAEFGFTKVHRFERVVEDATWAECRARVAGLAPQIPNLHLL